MLVGQGEELAHGLGTDRTHGLEQPFHHAAKHFSRLQIRRRPGQTWVAPVQHVGAQPLQPVNGPVQQLPDDRLGGRIPGQGVQVALHDCSGGFVIHDELPRQGGGIVADFIGSRVHLPLSGRLVEMSSR